MLPMVTMPLTTAPLGDLSVRRRSTVQGRSSPVSMGEQEAQPVDDEAGSLRPTRRLSTISRMVQRRSSYMALGPDADVNRVSRASERTGTPLSMQSVPEDPAAQRARAAPQRGIAAPRLTRVASLSSARAHAPASPSMLGPSVHPRANGSSAFGAPLVSAPASAPPASAPVAAPLPHAALEASSDAAVRLASNVALHVEPATDCINMFGPLQVTGSYSLSGTVRLVLPNAMGSVRELELRSLRVVFTGYSTYVDNATRYSALRLSLIHI